MNTLERRVASLELAAGMGAFTIGFSSNTDEAVIERYRAEHPEARVIIIERRIVRPGSSQ